MSNYIEHPLIRDKTIQARLYQQILYASSIKENTLIILPTGLGKTVIFIMVIAYFLEQKSNKSVIITAPTRPLVDQHFESSVEFLDIEKNEISIMSGTTSPEDRDKLWHKSKIHIATPQTLRNDIINRRVDLSQISLICFDEAHRAVGDDPYVLCAQEFAKSNPNGRILGFTASPGTKEKTFEILSNLKLDNVEYMDEDHPHVKPYVHDVTENWEWVDLPDEFSKILEIIKEKIKSKLQFLKDIGITNSIQISNNRKTKILDFPKKLKKNRKNLTDDEFYGGMAAYGQLMLLYQASEMIETQGVHTFVRYVENKIDQFNKSNKSSLRRFTQDKDIKKAFKLAKTLVNKEIYHPKLTALEKIITNQLNNSPNTRILVFANYKATISFLVSKLSTINNAKVHRFVGQSSSKYGLGLTQKEQKEIMDGFRKGDYNILVSTSVGEEGLDVAQCDLVVFYDVTPSATRLIQRSGRTGRAGVGKVIILITKGTRDESYFYASRNQKRRVKNSLSDIKKELKEEKNREKQASLENFFGEVTSNVDFVPPEKKSNRSKITSSPPKFEKLEDDIIIYVDHRERGAGLLRELLNRNIRIKQETLPIGDFILSQQIAVERKTTKDFIDTLKRNDLFDQIINLKKTYLKPILLIEGDNLYDTAMHKKSIQGALSSIIADFSVPIIFTNDEYETVDMLESIAGRAQKNKKNRPTIKTTQRSDSTYNRQISLLSALPGINRILAERILKHFKTPKEFFTAKQNEMKKVHGIGSNIANQIDLLLSTPIEDEL